MKKKLKNIDKLFVPAITWLILIIAWEIIVHLFKIEQYILPPPFIIIKTLVLSINILIPHIQFSLLTAISGLALAIVFSLFISTLMDLFPLLRKALYPILVMSQTIPIIFIYPLLMIWFGFGIVPKIIIVILVCFFPISVNLSDGLLNTDQEYIDLFKSMNAGKWKTFILVKLPGSMPQFFSGLKIAGTYSVIGAVISEWLGAKKGLGIYMIRSYKSFSTSNVFAAIIVVVLLSFSIFLLIKLLEKILLTWSFK